MLSPDAGEMVSNGWSWGRCEGMKALGSSMALSPGCSPPEAIRALKEKGFLSWLNVRGMAYFFWSYPLSYGLAPSGWHLRLLKQNFQTLS